MAVLNYATTFESRIHTMYEHKLKSYALFDTNPDVKFVNAKEIKIPLLNVSGYKDHVRGGGFNQGNYANEYETKKLEHDRDIEFTIDPMDVDETNLVVSIANVQSRFEKTQAIPELDCYTFSKLFAEAERVEATIKTDAITEANVLADFDANCEALEDAGVTLSECILYCTPEYKRILKNAEGVTRTVNVGKNGVALNREVYSLDDIKEIVTVPRHLFKTAYDFTEGFKATPTGKQINYILIDPNAQVSRVKYSYINVFPKGHDSRTADNYMYQNRRYNGTCTLHDEFFKAGCIISVKE